MFLVVKNVLTASEIDQIRQIAKSVRFVEGRASNPHNLAKDNLQMDVSQPDAVRASNIAGAAIARNEEIKNFVFPKRIASPLLARYEPGMKYGMHADGRAGHSAAERAAAIGCLRHAVAGRSVELRRRRTHDSSRQREGFGERRTGIDGGLSVHHAEIGRASCRER